MPSLVYASEDNLDVNIVRNDFANDNIVSIEVEGDNVYVITSSGGPKDTVGKCPSNSRVITTTVSRSTLKKWKKENVIPQKIVSLLTSLIGSVFKFAASFITDQLSSFLPNLVEQLENILKYNKSDPITVKCTYNCMNKYQSSHAFHVWMLHSVDVV